jgi:DNA-binding NarL/FixJ family response regulator
MRQADEPTRHAWESTMSAKPPNERGIKSSATGVASIHTGSGPELQRLTPRERAIAHLVCAGLTNKQIARQLTVTEGTIKMHLHNIYTKLAISNRTMLAWLGLEQMRLPDTRPTQVRSPVGCATDESQIQ